MRRLPAIHPVTSALGSSVPSRPRRRFVQHANSSSRRLPARSWSELLPGPPSSLAYLSLSRSVFSPKTVSKLGLLHLLMLSLFLSRLSLSLGLSLCSLSHSFFLSRSMFSLSLYSLVSSPTKEQQQATLAFSPLLSVFLHRKQRLASLCSISFSLFFFHAQPRMAFAIPSLLTLCFSRFISAEIALLFPSVL